MNYIKLLAIYFFDLIDKYIHQKNILRSLKNEKIKIKIFSMLAHIKENIQISYYIILI